jgi:hypothetical protein
LEVQFACLRLDQIEPALGTLKLLRLNLDNDAFVDSDGAFTGGLSIHAAVDQVAGYSALNVSIGSIAAARRAGT